MNTGELSLENGTLHLRGNVTFQTVTTLINKLEKAFTNDINALDCSAVTKVDSATIAFLLFSLKLAHKKQKTLKIVGVTDAIKKLMRLYGLQDVLA